MTKRIIEVFTAGCQVCEPTVELVKKMACDSCEVVIYDLNQGCDTNECREKAKQYSITRLPVIVVNGKVLDCCKSSGFSEQILKASLAQSRTS